MFPAAIRFLLCCLITALPVTGMALPDTFYVSGRTIHDPCGNVFVPRGINYPVLDDWGFPANLGSTEQSAEIRKANPNIVRIAWYSDYGQTSRPAYALKDLDSVITRFRRYQIVSVIVLMDATCNNDYSFFNTRINSWWTNPAVVALMQKHRGHVLLNIANEFGYVNWTGNGTAALTTWSNNYKATITAMRNAGLSSPIMIDAPDCGTSLDPLLNSAAGLQAHDPLHNIIFSAHAYWATAFGYDSVTLRSRLTQLVNAPVPVILGEIANFQSDTQPCQYPINYVSLLRMCRELNIGWLAWNWTNDYCNSRQMSSNGLFTSLSAYGNTLVNDAYFGLANSAVKSPYMQQISCTPTALPLPPMLQCRASVQQHTIQIEVAVQHINPAETIITQVSNNGVDWQDLDRRFINHEAHYTVIDNNPLPGKYYYRVLFLSPDGGRTYSPVQSLVNSHSGKLSIYYNEQGIPVISASEPVSLSVYNITGVLLFHTSLQAGEQWSASQLSLSNGCYLVHTQTAQGLTQTGKMVIHQAP
jgi:mannan endo-1,4-beta-mannosidase